MLSTNRLQWRPRSLPLLMAVIAILAPLPAYAIQASLAGVVDWHTKLIGIPRSDLPPTFYNVLIRGEDREVVVSVTDLGLLAVLDGSDGSVVWRTQFAPEDTPLAYAAEYDRLTVLSGSASSSTTLLSVFNSTAGHLLTTVALPTTPSSSPAPASGHSISFVPSNSPSIPSSILTLHGSGLGHLTQYTQVNKTSSAGIELSPHWSWTPADSGSTSYYLEAISTGERVHVVSTISGFSGSSLEYTWLETSAEALRLAREAAGSEEDSTAVLALHSAGSISIPSSVNSLEDFESIKIWNREKGEVIVTWYDRKRAARSSVIFGPTSKTAHVTAAQLQDDTSASTESIRTYHSPDRLATLSIRPDGSIRYNNSARGNQWVREEALADIRVVRMIELPEGKMLDTRGVLDEEGFGGRLGRHVRELKSLPSYIASFVTRFTSGTYAKSISSTPLSPSHLVRDPFGFQKLLLVATGTGKIFGLDSANGNVVWGTALGEGGGGERGRSSLDVLEMYTVRGAGEKGNPIVAIVAVNSETTETIAYHLDAFTGQALEVSDKPITAGQAQGQVIAAGSPLATFLLPVEHCTTAKKAVAIVDQEMKVHLFPNCKAIEASFQKLPSVHFAILDETTKTLRGRQVVLQRPIDGVYSTFESWSIPLGGPAASIKVHEQDNGPVSSIGRILWDRSTLYNYLNPHLIAVTVVDPQVLTAKLLVIDSVAGQVVYSTVARDVLLKEGVEAVLTNNWLVYKYSTRGGGSDAQLVHRIVSVELYEEEMADVVGESSPVAESGLALTPVWRSFILPSRISGLQTSRSRFGLTYKDLVFITDRGQLAFMPNKLLDPRRPDVHNKKHQEEMLIPYQAFLPFDTRRTVSHANDVLGLRSIITSPSLLESTSLVFSHGLDLFASRITPSGTFDILSDAFNKTQLILTILGLGLGISVARPAVGKRMVRARWY